MFNFVIIHSQFMVLMQCFSCAIQGFHIFRAALMQNNEMLSEVNAIACVLSCFTKKC